MARKPVNLKDFKIEMVPTDKLIQYCNNPKAHPAKQVDKIASSIKNFGFLVPLVIDKGNEIVAGHGRLEAARKGISSLQLSKEIGITQKSAWFMLHRLREACGDDLAELRGIIEVDETYIGGKETAKHESKKLKEGRGSVGKVGVVGLRERGGNTVAKPFDRPDKATLHGAILDHVAIGSMIHTDDAPVYSGLDGLFYQHRSVNHSAGDYVKDGVTTNSIDSVWAVLKRGLHGVYHHASPKHLHRYVDEFTFRLNDGNCKRHTLLRLESFVAAVANKRLTYAALTS